MKEPKFWLIIFHVLLFVLTFYEREISLWSFLDVISMMSILTENLYTIVFCSLFSFSKRKNYEDFYIWSENRQSVYWILEVNLLVMNLFMFIKWIDRNGKVTFSQKSMELCEFSGSKIRVHRKSMFMFMFVFLQIESDRIAIENLQL